MTPFDLIQDRKKARLDGLFAVLWRMVKLMCLAALSLLAQNGFAETITLDWRDYQGTEQNISLRIPLERLSAAMLEGRDQVSLSTVLEQSFIAAKAYAARKSTPSKVIEVLGSASSYAFNAQGDTDLEATLKADFMAGFNQSPQRGYFIFDGAAGGFRPDYLAILADNADVFPLVAQALLRRFGAENPEELVNQLLSMLQQIPYDDMASQGFPMATPIQMLVENRGDCETKQLFMLGVLKALFPDRAMALVSLPRLNHILGAIELDRDVSSRVEHDSRSFVLLDATGPTAQPFGEVFPYHRDSPGKQWIFFN